MKRMTGILLSLLLCSGASAQPDTLWTRVYGGEGMDWGRCIEVCDDRGFAIIGSTSSFGPDGTNTWLIKTNSEGDTLWTKTYPRSLGAGIQQTQDGGYIICGYEQAYTTYIHAYLIRTDSDGDTLWTKSYEDALPPGFEQSRANSVLQTDEGGFIFAGMISPSGSPFQAYLVKTSALGDTAWTQIIGGAGYEELDNIKSVSDGGFVSVGVTSSYGAGSSDVYLIRTDADGNLIWTNAYGGIGQDAGSAVEPTSDGGFIIAGYSSLAPIPEYDTYLIRTDAQGDTLWTKRYDGAGTDAGWDVQQVQDNGFVIVGSTNSIPPDSADLWVFRTDDNGDTLWTKRLGLHSGDCGQSLRQMADGGYIIAGFTNSTVTTSDVWLVRLAEDIAAADPPKSIVPSNFAFYPPFPNPFNPVTKLKFSLPSESGISLSVFDIHGRLVGLLADGLYNAGIHEVSFDANDLPSGLYLCQIQTSFGKSTVKMMLMK